MYCVCLTSEAQRLSYAPCLRRPRFQRLQFVFRGCELRYSRHDSRAEPAVCRILEADKYCTHLSGGIAPGRYQRMSGRGNWRGRSVGSDGSGSRRRGRGSGAGADGGRPSRCECHRSRLLRLWRGGSRRRRWFFVGRRIWYHGRMTRRRYGGRGRRRRHRAGDYGGRR